MPQPIDTNEYPAFDSKQQALQEFQQRADETGSDFNDLLQRLNVSDTTGWSDGATVTEISRSYTV